MNAFKTARLSAGLSVQEVADRVGVTASAISNWERGIASPNARRIPKLAKALKVTPVAVINMFNE